MKVMANQKVGAGGIPLVSTTEGFWKELPPTYLGEAALETYLNEGVLPSPDELDQSATAEFFEPEPRVGVGLSPATLTSEEGLLYTSTFLRLKPGTALECDLEFPSEAETETLRAYHVQRPWLKLGGEGKVARIEVCDKPWAPWPPPNPGAHQRALLYLATPGLFRQGRWKPKNLRPVAGAVGSPTVVSGWDLATNAPMRTRYAVPAGAVYFLDGDGLNGVPDPHGTCLSDDPADAASGWGYCLRGAW